MTKPEKCLLCGHDIRRALHDQVYCSYPSCPLFLSRIEACHWPRVRALFRKGLMFEWAERMMRISDAGWGEALIKARDWWRKRRRA